MQNIKSKNVIVRFISSPGGLVIIVILLGIMSTFLPRLETTTNDNQVTETKVYISEILKNLEEYQQKCSSLPPSLDSLKPNESTGSNGCSNWTPPAHLRLLDAWNRPFIYEIKEGEPSILSLGRDGQPGGDDFDADITSHEIP